MRPFQRPFADLDPHLGWVVHSRLPHAVGVLQILQISRRSPGLWTAWLRRQLGGIQFVEGFARPNLGSQDRSRGGANDEIGCGQVNASIVQAFQDARFPSMAGWATSAEDECSFRRVG